MMFELSEEQRLRTYQMCNSMNLENLLQYLLHSKESGITLEGLEKAHYKKIDQLKKRYYAEAEESIWNQSQDSIEGINDYLSKCDRGDVSGKYRNEAIALRAKMAKICEEKDWGIAKNSHDIAVLDQFIQKCYSGIYSQTYQVEAENLRSGWLEEILNQEWEAVISAIELNQKRTLINDFIAKYSNNVALSSSKEMVGRYLAQAHKLLEGLADEEQARIDWFDTKKENNILSYAHFIENHPYCSYREEAEREIANLKENLLSDLKQHPMRYSREMMHKLISNNTLTQSELVDQSYILTDRAYNHILKYPTLQSEQRQLPVSKLEDPTSEEGNTDIYFFGVSGSGKTCVLAGLMSLTGQCGFKFDPKGQGGGGNYAMDLQQYARKSMLPPATDQHYIQVIDAVINDESGNSHKLSLIEMSGEKTAQFANISNSTSLEDLGPGAAGLLSNNNRKVFFFVVDPTNNKDIHLGEDGDIWVQQSNVLDCVASLLSKNPALLKKIDAMHIILTKSDSLGDHVTKEMVQDLFAKEGYAVVLDGLKEMCEKHHINIPNGNAVGVYPFSVGHFMPGDVYTFDESDSMKILRVIQHNTRAVRPQSWKEKISEWFNS